MDLPSILNVALGLVVLYFLLSAIASLLIELCTTTLRYREEILYVTINRLLAGQPDTPWNFWQLLSDRVGLRLRGIPGAGWLGSLLIKEHRVATPGKAKDDPSDDIVQQFWRHPKIKSLAAPGVDSPPSMEPSTFARTLVDLVVPRDAVGALPDNPLALSRALAVPQTTCPPALRLTLQKLAAAGDIPRTATGEAMWTPFCASIATWFEEASKRSTEQYRQAMRTWLLCTGFALAFVLNADTIRTVQLLSNDRSLQEATAAFAATLVKPVEGGETAAEAAKTAQDLRKALSQDIGRLRELEAIGFPLGWHGPDKGFYSFGLYHRAMKSAGTSLLAAAGWMFCLGFLKFVGLVATALAVAQGAPFWYDIMTKLLNLKKGQGETATAAGSVTAANGPASTPTTVVSRELPLEVGHDLAAPGSGFDPRKAYWLAEASAIAYAPEAEIRSLVQASWKFHQMEFFDCQGTQAFCACDDKLVLVAFRGTELKELADILADARVTLDPFPKTDPAAKPKVHRGFQDALTAVQPKLAQTVGSWMLPASPGGPVRRLLITGHSLGGALATLYFAEVAGIYAAAGPLLYTFGCPKVGDDHFAQTLDRQYPGRVFRLINQTDIVPELPPLPDYHHTGSARHFDGDQLRTHVSGLSRLLGYAAGAAQSLKAAGQAAVDDHGMNHYIERCAKLVKPA